MQEGAKKRLVGVIALVALAVIFVPMMFEAETPPVVSPDPVLVPDEPVIEERFSAETFLTPADSGVGGLASDELLIEPGMLVSPPPSETAASIVEEPVLPDPALEVGEPAGESSPASAPASSARPASASTPSAPAVSAPPPRGAPDGMPSWVTQVASLGSAASAEQMAEKLRGQGYSAFVEQANVGGRLYYRVRVGPELDRASAERTADKLSREYDKPFVQRYP
jgi:DedD protein